MLGRQCLHEGQRGLHVVHEHGARGRQPIEHRRVVTHRHGQRALAMLGLRQQIQAQRLDVRARRRDHGEIGRPREPVDPDHVRDLPLGLLHPQRARPGDHVHPRDRLRAVGQGRHRLGARDGQERVHAAQFRGSDHHRVRRADDVDLVDAGGPRRDGAHDHGGRIGVAATGRVDRRAPHGHIAQFDRLPLAQGDQPVLVEPRLGDGAHVADRDLETLPNGGSEQPAGEPERRLRPPAEARLVAPPARRPRARGRRR